MRNESSIGVKGARIPNSVGSLMAPLASLKRIQSDTPGTACVCSKFAPSGWGGPATRPPGCEAYWPLEG